jgi:hypothetical protein
VLSSTSWRCGRWPSWLARSSPQPTGGRPAASISVQQRLKLRKDPGLEHYLIEYLEKTTAENLSESGMDLHLQVRLLSRLNAPYEFDMPGRGLRLTDLISDSAFDLHSARRIEEGKESLIEIEFSCAGEGEHRIDSATVQLAPDRDWAIRRFDLTFPNERWGGLTAHETGFVDYAPGRKGQAVPARIYEKFEQMHPQGIVTQSRDLMVTSFSDSGLSEAQFELPAFGLPDVDPEPSRSTNLLSVRGWLFWTSATVAIVAFPILRVLAWRERKGAPA